MHKKSRELTYRLTSKQQGTQGTYFAHKFTRITVEFHTTRRGSKSEGEEAKRGGGRRVRRGKDE